MNKGKKNVFECFYDDTEKYWKYQYISIYFLILDIDINICIFPEKKYNIHIWRIKWYFTVPKYWFTEHWSAPPGWDRVIVSENLGKAAALLASPLITPMQLIIAITSLHNLLLGYLTLQEDIQLFYTLCFHQQYSRLGSWSCRVDLADLQSWNGIPESQKGEK